LWKHKTYLFCTLLFLWLYRTNIQMLQVLLPNYNYGVATKTYPSRWGPIEEYHLYRIFLCLIIITYYFKYHVKIIIYYSTGSENVFFIIIMIYQVYTMLQWDPESAPLSEISTRKFYGLSHLKIFSNSPKTNRYKFNFNISFYKYCEKCS